MTPPLKRAVEVVAALLVLANTIYFAASWERDQIRIILVALLVIAAVAVLIVRYLPAYTRDAVRKEFARQRVLDGVEARTDTPASRTAGEGVIELDRRREGLSLVLRSPTPPVTDRSPPSGRAVPMCDSRCRVPRPSHGLFHAGRVS